MSIPDYPTAPHHPGSPSYSPPKVEGRQHVADEMWRIGMNVDWAYIRLNVVLDVLKSKVAEHRFAALIAAALDAWDATAADIARQLDEVSAAGHVTLSPIAIEPWRKWLDDYMERANAPPAAALTDLARLGQEIDAIAPRPSPIDQTLDSLSRMESNASGNPEWPAVRNAVAACRAILAGLQASKEDAP